MNADDRLDELCDAIRDLALGLRGKTHTVQVMLDPDRFEVIRCEDGEYERIIYIAEPPRETRAAH